MTHGFIIKNFANNFYVFLLLTTSKSYSGTKTDTEDQYKKKSKNKHDSDVQSKADSDKYGDSEIVFGKPLPSLPKNKQTNFVHFLWWVHKIQCMRRKVNIMYTTHPVGSLRELKCWNWHVCLWILHINIIFENFVWFFQCSVFVPLLVHFKKLRKNDNSKLKMKERLT